MDKLRSENGCPWDAQQTHESLSEFLLEETYETLAAIEEGEPADLVEELGDLLLQVVFHARLGEEEAPQWDIDDVANGISDKLIRRHPHVQALQPEVDRVDEPIPLGDLGRVSPEPIPLDPDQLSRNWTRAKAVEKGRTSALDGIPRAMPGLAQAQKTWRRAVESGLAPIGSGDPTGQFSAQARSPQDPHEPALPVQPVDHEQLGEALLGMAIVAERAGMDAEASLRSAIARLRLEIQGLESPTQPG